MRWKQSVQNGKYKIPSLMKIAMRASFGIIKLNITYIYFRRKVNNFLVYYLVLKQNFQYRF